MISLTKVTLPWLTAVRSIWPDFPIRTVTSAARPFRKVSDPVSDGEAHQVTRSVLLPFLCPVNEKVRIIRGCGYINDTMDSVPPGAQLEDQCVRRTGTFSVMIENCVCNSGDGCNHSASVTFSYLMNYLLPVAFTAVLLRVR